MIKITRNQIKTQGVSQLAKSFLKTVEEWERKRGKRGGLKQSEDPGLEGASPEGAGTTGVGLQSEPSSFSLTQILSVASVVLPLAWIVPPGTEWPPKGIRWFEKNESTPPSLKRIIFTLSSELANVTCEKLKFSWNQGYFENASEMFFLIKIDLKSR